MYATSVAYRHMFLKKSINQSVIQFKTNPASGHSLIKAIVLDDACSVVTIVFFLVSINVYNNMPK